jgi:asparagine synthase (glutamine-hydrolysing)
VALVSGIVGTVLVRADRRPDRAILEAMASRLAHRGPDDAGFVVRGAAGLGSRRRKTIDPETGRQPLTGEDGSIWVVVDGAIYNHRELASRLAAHGHVLRSRSDTEPIVHAWEMRGPDALEDLEGMFALAVWHEPSQTLVLARDRLGVKPLYYALLPDQIVFASELGAMLAHPSISRELDVDALSAYLAHDYVPAPRSMLGAVRKLPPGHRLVYAGGEAKLERWWDVRYGDSGPAAEIVGVAHLAAALDLAVRQHLTTDLPLGILMSGGIGSATVAAIARGYTTSRLRTFAVGFGDSAADETAAVRATAEALSGEHHELVLGARDVVDAMLSLADVLDEPLGDAGILSTHLLARFARRSVTVALSGAGVDEVFPGAATSPVQKLARLLGWGAAPRSEAVAESDRRGPFAPDEQQGLLSAEARARMSAARSSAAVRALEPTGNQNGSLAERLLARIDRAAMACSLEVRLPLVDRRVVEVAALLGPQARHILTRAVRRRVPDSALRGPGKDVGVPLERWFGRELNSLFDEVFEPAALRRSGMLNGETIRRLLDEHRQGVRDHRRKLYALLVFLLWSRRYKVDYL